MLKVSEYYLINCNVKLTSFKSNMNGENGQTEAYSDTQFSDGCRVDRDFFWFACKINTRTGGGHIMLPHLFFANNLKTAARSAAKFGITAHNS